MKSANLKFIFGIILIICGWIICFDVFLLLIGLAFFLLGTILVLFSKKTLLIKSVVILIPILLWFIGFEIILHAINKKTPVALLIPDSFCGQIRIVDGEINGIEPSEGGGELHLVVPANGIVIVKPHLNIDFEHTTFWNVKPQFMGDQTTKMNSVEQKNSKITKFPAVIFEGMSSSVGLPGQSSDVPVALDYVYHSFYVLQNDSSSVPTYQDEMKNNSMTDSLVKIERGIK